MLSRPRDAAAAAPSGGRGEGVETSDVDRRATSRGLTARRGSAALPSFGEAFGLVLVESLACGTPVVGAAAGAIPEVIDRPEIGRTFAPFTAEALAEALLGALELADDRATVAACRERAEDFSAERFVERHVELYAELGAGR